MAAVRFGARSLRIVICCSVIGALAVVGGMSVGSRGAFAAQPTALVVDGQGSLLSCLPPVTVNSGCQRAPYDGLEEFEVTIYNCETDEEQSAGFETYSWGFTEEVMDGLELCPQQPGSGGNQSFFFMAKIYTCEGANMSDVTLTAYAYEGGPSIGSWSLGTGSVTSPALISSTCFDSCSWPGYLEVTINYAFIDYVEWYVGCCYCECYSDPCQ